MSCNFSFLPSLTSMKRRALALVVLVLAGMSPQALAATGSIANADPYDVTAAYPTPGTRVSYTEEDDDGVLRGAIFTNSWYINPGIAPTFYPGSTGWVKEGPTLLLANAEDTTGDIESNPQWHLEAAYTGGNIVAYESVCYRAKWWTRGQIPTSDGSPWEIVGCGETETIIDPNQMVEANTDNDADSGDSGDSDGGSGSSTPSEAIPQWAAEGVFIARSVVQMDNVCYQANWWTQGDEPVPASELTNIWDSPWEEVDPCPAQAIAPPDSGSQSGAGGSGGIDKMPAPIVVTEEGDDSDMAATEGAGDTTDNLVTPVVPPVVPVAMDDERVPAPAVPVELPSEGYEFLRQVTNEHWNWMFPLRSGRYVAPTAGGGARNS